MSAGVTASLDGEASKRGLASVVDGAAVSLARPVDPLSVSHDKEGKPIFDGLGLDLTSRQYGTVRVGYDRLTVACHGTGNTHLDALGHIGMDGALFAQAGPLPTLADWARSGLLTRGVFLDVPGARGVEALAPDAPATADDLDRALVRSGVDLEPGDAALLHLGRAAVESAGAPLFPGVDASAAQWLADRRVPLLCWDLLDSPTERHEDLAVHLLIPRIGLAIVDNCDFSRLVPVMATRTLKVGLLVVAPLNIEQATGCLVNPLLIT